MFLHIGGNTYILKGDIVAILDKDTLNHSKKANEIVQKLIENGSLKGEEMDLDNVKSYIITCKRRFNSKNRKLEKEYGLYLSSISSTTLLRRNEDMETRMEV